MRAVALALAVALSAPAAHAQSQDARRDSAKALVAQGSALYQEQAYAAALAKFRQAFELYPNPKIYFDIAQAAAHLNDPITAANAYQSFLDQTLEAADLAKARASAREQLGKLAQRLGRLQVSAEPPGAEVRLDGTSSPDRASYLAPGKHEVQVSKAGFVTQTETVELAAAQLRELQIALKPVPAPAPLASAPVDVPAAKPPAPEVHSAPAGGLSAKPPERVNTAGWLCVGAGATFAAAGALTGILALSDNSKLSALVAGVSPPNGLTASDAPGLRDRVRTESTLSTVALPVGLAALGVGTYLLLSHGDAPKPQSP